MDNSRALRWRGRGLTFEAALYLLTAWLLIAILRFGRWRKLLGPLVTTPSAQRRATTAPRPEDRRLALAVERACGRLAPIRFKCLPRAMAVHWMMRRRGRPCMLVLAILGAQARGTLDDLHAWAERDGAILIGESTLPYRILARFGWPDDRM